MRNEKDSGRNDRRSSADIDQKPVGPNPNNAVINPQLYQQNIPFTTNMSQLMMNKAPMMPPNNTIDPNLMQHSNDKQQTMSAFSTNDVRTMNMKMNMNLQTNPLAFQQQMYNQQNVSIPAFNTQSLQGGQAIQYAHQQLQASMGNQMNKFGNGMNQSNAISNGNHCVRVRNLDNLTTYSGLRKFFSGLLIPNDGIKMINDTDGNRTGQAVVRFARTTTVALAIQRNGQKLGRNIVQVEPIDDKAYEESVDAFRRRERYDRDRDRERIRERDRDHRDDGRANRDNRNRYNNRNKR